MMNDIIQAILLGLLQGFTEFLPVSSSAHLILLPKFMGWQDFGLSFDVVIHLGSLVAIISYFLKDQQFKQKFSSRSYYKLFWLITLATIPVGLSGLFFKHLIEHSARSIQLIAITTIVFGLILGVAYYYNQRNKMDLNIKQLSIKYALLIGLAQAIAIIPGVSRSGITLTAGLLLGFDIFSASRFSFLLAIPVIFLAGAKQSLDLIINNQLILNMPILIAGFLSSMISSFMFVFLFFKYINKIGIWPFVIYRVFLGSLLWIISC